MTKDLKSAAIYGAMIVTQVQDYQRLGRDITEPGLMEHFIEEAEAVVEIHAEALLEINK